MDLAEGVDRELPTGCGKPCGRHVEDQPCAVDHSAPATMAVVTGDGDETYAGGPVNALRRIAFLLERSRAETYKVKAFRSAADTILPLGDEVAARVREGTLRKLPGIGAYTAAAIAAIAFGRDSCPIDTNVERVVARLHAITDKGAIREVAEAMIPAGRAGDRVRVKAVRLGEA